MNGDFQFFKFPGRSQKLSFFVVFSRSGQHLAKAFFQGFRARVGILFQKAF